MAAPVDPTATAASEWSVDPLTVARTEARQYREAMSHHRQIAEHYRDALAAVLAVRSHVPAPWTVDFDRAMVAARVALDHPPEWDGVLHA